MRRGLVEKSRGGNIPVKRRMDVPTDDVVIGGKKEELKPVIDGMETGVRRRPRLEKGPSVPDDWNWPTEEVTSEDEEEGQDDGGFVFRTKKRVKNLNKK